MQMPSNILKPQIASNNPPLHKSHSINNFAANALRKSDDKKSDTSEQLSPMKPISDTNSSNQHKFLKISLKIQIPEYK